MRLLGGLILMRRYASLFHGLAREWGRRVPQTNGLAAEAVDWTTRDHRERMG
jgi:hypothetical protein